MNVTSSYSPFLRIRAASLGKLRSWSMISRRDGKVPLRVLVERDRLSGNGGGVRLDQSDSPTPGMSPASHMSSTLG